jgi:hypothetical protein
MAHMLVVKNREMKDCQAATARTNLCQSTMTQEFETVADQSSFETLPPDWIQLWDNKGNYPYYFNVADTNIQYDFVLVHAKIAMKVARLVEDKENKLDLSEQDAFCGVPDDVCSAYRNTIISLDQVPSKQSSLPSKTSFGGYVNMSYSSSDEEKKRTTTMTPTTHLLLLILRPWQPRNPGQRNVARFGRSKCKTSPIHKVSWERILWSISKVMRSNLEKTHLSSKR